MSSWWFGVRVVWKILEMPVEIPSRLRSFGSESTTQKLWQIVMGSPKNFWEDLASHHRVSPLICGPREPTKRMKWNMGMHQVTYEITALWGLFTSNLTYFNPAILTRKPGYSSGVTVRNRGIPKMAILVRKWCSFQKPYILKKSKKNCL